MARYDPRSDPTIYYCERVGHYVGKGLVYDERQGMFVRKGLGTTSGTAGGYAAGTGPHTYRADDGGTAAGGGRTPCPLCDGSGSCRRCGGTGTMWHADCQACEGSGDCPGCAGGGVTRGRPLSPAVARAFGKLLDTVRRRYGARLGG
jgi:hypothetical protein